MQYLQIVLLVIELVKIVEKLMPEKGKGAEKLSLVRAMVEEAVGDIQEIWPQIERVIAIFVKLANAAGTFSK
jgi:hypothetical protein